jgi:hypothetical protein
MALQFGKKKELHLRQYVGAVSCTDSLILDIFKTGIATSSKTGRRLPIPVH